ncbi:MAG: hypothetical protein A2138_12650 [Deltaproteobacteria bacterium RBG_16_71_12]|nr:MAG: hypothetical protein A2138_12650 [Deltaproteobacteria bacterium RBG_16_71_12]
MSNTLESRSHISSGCARVKAAGPSSSTHLVTSFYQRHYQPSRVTVIVVAGLEPGALRGAIERGLHGAPVPAEPHAVEQRGANAPSEARGTGRTTLAVSAHVTDAAPDAACHTAAQLLELRLRRRVAAEDASAETHGGCEPAFGHTLLTLAARSSSPASSMLPELVREVRRSARAQPPTAAERSQVAAHVARLHQAALATPTGLAALLVAAARAEAPLEQGAAQALRAPRLDWPRAARVLASAADDRRAVEVAFSPFTR